MTDNEERRIQRDRDGYLIRLPDPERALLVQLAGELIGVLDSVSSSGPTPENLRRLFPSVHTLDAPAEDEDQARRSIYLGQRQEALGVLRRSASIERLTDDEADLWLEAINVLRLAIGTHLDVTEEPIDVAESDPAFAEWVYYQYLTFLESEMIDAMSGALPAPIPGAGEDSPEDPWGEPLGGLRWDGTPLPDAPKR